MYEYYYFTNIAIVFIALLYSTITDIKSREVSNYVSLGLLIYGTIANSIFYLLTSGYPSLIYFLIFDALVFLICYLFWQLGIFAGGDAKLYSGIAATIPVLGTSIFNLGTSGLPFVLSLFILSILVMFPIALVNLFTKYFKKNNVREKVKETLSKNTKSFIFNILYIVSLFFIFDLFQLPLWIFIITSILLAFVPKKIKYPLSIILFIFSIILSVETTVSVMFAAILISLGLSVLINLFIVSRSGILNYKKDVKHLKDGDLLAYPLMLSEDKGFEELHFNFMQEVKVAFKYCLKGDMGHLQNVFTKRKKLYSKIVINNNLACGLTVDEIKMIQKHFKGELELKETTPLVPSIFIAFVLMLCFGDLIWYLITLI